MEPHDLHSYRMQWPHHNSAEIITEEVYEDAGDDDVIEEEYLVGEEIIPTNEINAISNTLDQSAAQNLIYMAQEGNMAMGDLIEEQVEQAENGDYNEPEYFECQVTEEVITDDWVQRQGEERIEIIIDSIESSQAQESAVTNADDDIDVSLPTVQDEYTASRPYPCDFCSRRFRKKANLINHMVAHQQERPHVCHLCGARYIRKSDLMQHLKIHAYIPEEQEQASDHERPPQRGGKRGKGNNTSMLATSSSGAAGRGGLGKSKPPPFEHHFIEDDVKLLCDVANQSQQSPVSDPNDRSSVRFPVIDDRRPFVCQQCGLSFSREKALASHTKSHSMDTQYECEQCGEAFYDMALLREHEYSHANNVVEYEEEPSTSQYRNRHDTEGDEEEYDDDNRDGTYMPIKQERMAKAGQEEEENVNDDDDEDDEDYQASAGSGNEFGIYYCDHCGMSFHRVNLLRQHVKTHLRQLNASSADEHACSVCGQIFAEALDLFTHAELHVRQQCVKCLVCGEEVMDDNRLEQHVQTMHKLELSPTMCGVCGKQCRDEKSLQKHSFEHSAAMKKVQCPICDKTFQNKARLKRHLLSHRKRTVQCDICMEEFADGRTLMNHRHSHTTGLAKKFPCKTCGKSFGSRSSQQIHVRMHTGERPYGCRYCWKSFADGGTLRKHERIHTGEKPYGCVVCPRAFNQRVVLREHIRSHHSAPDPTRLGLVTPFYCQLCHNSFTKAELLISDLIAHCDANTKRQRPVQVGPRKYKRRRKLKPHELKMMKSTGLEYSEDEANLVDSDAFTEDPKPEIRHVGRSTSGKRRVAENDHYYNEPEAINTFVYDETSQEEEQHQQPQPPQRVSMSSGRSTGRGRSGAAAAEALNSSGRPKMIHTEKSRVAASDGKRRTVTTTRSTPKVVAATSIGTRRSRRHNEPAFAVRSEPQGGVGEEEEEGVEGLGMSSTQLADVLENQKNSDKYSVDIVNDLESILCSPIRPRVSESSTTAPDYSCLYPLNGVVMDGDEDEEEELVVDYEAPKQKKQRQTIIECRRAYLPAASTEERLKKQYTAKIAAGTSSAATTTTSSAQYGIVRVNKIAGSSNATGNCSRVQATKREIYSTTEDESETLDDLLRRESREPQAKKGLHQCQICDIVMTDKHQLLQHAKTHF